MKIDEISTKAKAGLGGSRRLLNRLHRSMLPLPPMSIGRLSGLLVLASALPMLALALLMYQQMLANAQQAARDGLMSNARALAALVDAEIDTHWAVAGTLATADVLRKGDLQSFHRHAKQALENLPGSWLDLLTPSRQILMSTVREINSPMPQANEPDIGPANGATGLQRVSDIVGSPIAKRPVAFVEYPVLQDGRPLYTIAISLEPERFHELLRGKFATEAAIAIIDRQHRFVARVPDHDRRLGTLAAVGWRDEIARASEGVSETVTLEGRLSLTAYVTTRDGWIAGISYPKEALAASAHQTLRSIASIGAVAIAASLALGFLLSQRLSDILVDVARTARRVGSGQTVSAQPYAIDEAATISKALSETSHRLVARQEALRESEIRFRGTFENAAVGVAHVGLDGRWWEVNERLCEMLGYTRDELQAKTVEDVTHPSDHADEADQRQRLVATELTSYAMDKRCIRRDGSTIWTGFTVTLRCDEMGAPLYFISIISDITERKEFQDQQKFLLRELAHRLKNQLSIIQSMANQTARNAGSVDEFREHFTQRARALAIGTDLLIDENWSGANLAELVHRQLDPFSPSPSRLLSEGPSISVGAEATHAIGLALHELATNCIKYGSWSSPYGQVQISWKSIKAAEPTDGCALHVIWRETGGPKISPPARKGFGHVVIESMVAIKVGGSVSLSFLTDGLEWELTVPSSQYRNTQPIGHML